MAFGPALAELFDAVVVMGFVHCFGYLDGAVVSGYWLGFAAKLFEGAAGGN